MAARYRVLSARHTTLTRYPGRRSPRCNALRSLHRVGLPWAGISRALGPNGLQPISLQDSGDLNEQYWFEARALFQLRAKGPVLKPNATYFP